MEYKSLESIDDSLDIIFEGQTLSTINRLLLKRLIVVHRMSEMVGASTHTNPHGSTYVVYEELHKDVVSRNERLAALSDVKYRIEKEL